jgi:hypothetical protein
MIGRGVRLPRWYRERPKKGPTDDFWLRSFFDLSTCRDIGMQAGPIPWTAMRQYFDSLELDPDFFDTFRAVIRGMDSAWREWADKQKPDKEGDE